MSPEERQNLITKNPYKKKILESQVTIVEGDELNPIIKDAYNTVVYCFDVYRQFQLYNWHTGLEENGGIIGYVLCSNTETFLSQYEELKAIREIEKIKEFTPLDIEYVNRINTLYHAIDFSKLRLLKPAIESYMSRLDPSSSSYEFDKNVAMETLEQFDKTFNAEKVDHLPIPVWADYDSYYFTLKNIPYIQDKATLLDMTEQLIDYIPENIQYALEFIGNYREAEEIITLAYPEFEDYLPGNAIEEALEVESV